MGRDARNPASIIYVSLGSYWLGLLPIDQFCNGHPSVVDNVYRAFRKCDRGEGDAAADDRVRHDDCPNCPKHFRNRPPMVLRDDSGIGVFVHSLHLLNVWKQINTIPLFPILARTRCLVRIRY